MCIHFMCVYDTGAIHNSIPQWFLVTASGKGSSLVGLTKGDFHFVWNTPQWERVAFRIRKTTMERQKKKRTWTQKEKGKQSASGKDPMGMGWLINPQEGGLARVAPGPGGSRPPSPIRAPPRDRMGHLICSQGICRAFPWRSSLLCSTVRLDHATRFSTETWADETCQVWADILRAIAWSPQLCCSFLFVCSWQWLLPHSGSQNEKDTWCRARDNWPPSWRNHSAASH